MPRPELSDIAGTVALFALLFLFLNSSPTWVPLSQ